MPPSLMFISAILILLVAGVLIGGFAVKAYMRRIESNLKELAELSIPDIDLAKIDDGTYTGKHSVFPVSAEVRVVVKNHIIEDIVLVKHVNGRGRPAEVIPGNVVHAQTLKVHAVSGATYSSKVILRAILNALESVGKSQIP